MENLLVMMIYKFVKNGFIPTLNFLTFYNEKFLEIIFNFLNFIRTALGYILP